MIFKLLFIIINAVIYSNYEKLFQMFLKLLRICSDNIVLESSNVVISHKLHFLMFPKGNNWTVLNLACKLYDITIISDPAV